MLRRAFGFAVQVEEVGGDVGFEALVFGGVVERAAVAGALQIDWEGFAKGGFGAHGEGDDAVGHEDGFVDIVGDEDGGLFLAAPDFQDFVLKDGAVEGIEGGERLVEQEDFRLHGKGAGEGDALAHAAGEFVGFLVPWRR